MSPTEEDLEAFRRFLFAEGEWWHLGGGITTYPNDDGKHAILLELEKRGLSHRHRDGIALGDDVPNITWCPEGKCDYCQEQRESA